jgi:hypothetical protein
VFMSDKCSRIRVALDRGDVHIIVKVIIGFNLSGGGGLQGQGRKTGCM